MSALMKVATPLSERYRTTCAHCGHDRQFFGTADEARRSALTMGWEFRALPMSQCVSSKERDERAYCPHCKLLVKT